MGWGKLWHQVVIKLLPCTISGNIKLKFSDNYFHGCVTNPYVTCGVYTFGKNSVTALFSNNNNCPGISNFIPHW